jgi:organic hydroperoxide reductase OsmC/OhrA
MQRLPHHYSAAATAVPGQNVTLTSAGLAPIDSAAPAEFGGPGDRWSPETLLVAAVADCFILTFQAIADASKMDWISLSCDVEGTLDRVDRVNRFTAFSVRAVLDVPQGVDQKKATLLLEKSERACLITNSLNADMHLDTEVRVR